MAYLCNISRTADGVLRDGQAGISPDTVLVTVDKPYHIKNPKPPVAVLTSQL
ncbi:hypothetical protein KDA_30900 [Dictyobacter alpinus]|uniref:Uncharacterized protein n=1 Tax=Dictyobacter alpinus TaxID=2014873 RepID=A0A402B8E2_9CHLR|nr:hypothetical protein [Dictyobacter alpinus]GCE27606.1 hypothetical protein KDA_30900 [Dictyobacter alpinus]